MKNIPFATPITIVFLILSVSISMGEGGFDGIDSKRLDISYIDQAFRPFFTALKNGNLDIIRNHIDGEIYENKKVLLEKNKYYGQFLRKFYRDVEFKVVNVIKEDDGIIVMVKMHRIDGEESTISVKLVKGKRSQTDSSDSLHSSNEWRIVKNLSHITD